MYLTGKQRRYLRDELADPSPPRRTGKRKPAGVVYQASKQEQKRRAEALDHAFSAMTRPLSPPGRKPKP